MASVEDCDRALRSLAERLRFLRAVDAIQADALRLFVMQDFDRVAVDNGDDEAGELCRPAFTYKQQDRA